MVKTPEELYKEREKRVVDAISLKVPDRVPIALIDNFYSIKYAGVTLEEAMTDYEKACAAWKKVQAYFEWDMFSYIPVTVSGKVFDYLGSRQLKWPGHGSNKTQYQFVEPGTEYEAMPAEDYDWFIDDPSDYIIRRHWPRVYGVLEPFKNLPPIHNMVSHFGLFDMLPNMGTPEISNAFESLLKAGREYVKWLNVNLQSIQELIKMGFPPYYLGFTQCPFDFIADYLRGTKGALTDMSRNPDKLKKAQEKIVPWMIDYGEWMAKITYCPRIVLFLHKGAGGFMSNQQYEEFYWPYLRKVIMGLIDRGLTPLVNTQGIYTDRFQIISDVPKGKVLYQVESDIFKAKEILGDTACLTGGPPASLLNVGSPQEVKDYCKKLIDVVGEGGGFIMGSAFPLVTAKDENMRALTDFTREYGIYKK